MSDKELEELQDPDTWESNDDEVRPAVVPSRAVVSVSFPREDFDRVVERAQEQGEKTSAFIRDAVLSQLDSPTTQSFIIQSVSGNVQTEYPAVRNRAARGAVKIRRQHTSHTN